MYIIISYTYIYIILYISTNTVVCLCLDIIINRIQNGVLFKWFLYLVLFPPLKKYCSPYSYAIMTHRQVVLQYSVGDKIFTIHTLLAIS